MNIASRMRDWSNSLKEGMARSRELFASFFSQTLPEIKEKYVDFHKKQDEWLNQALDDYAKNLTSKEIGQLQQKAPSDDDMKKQRLFKKISKTEKLMKKALERHGPDSEAYLEYVDKLKEYLVRKEELAGAKIGRSKRSSKGKVRRRKSELRDSKLGPSNSTTGRRRSESALRDRDKKTRARKSTSSLKRRTSKDRGSLVDDDNEISMTKPTKSGKRKSKRKSKKEKKDKKADKGITATTSVIHPGESQDTGKEK